jgi:cytochrome c556
MGAIMTKKSAGTIALGLSVLMGSQAHAQFKNDEHAVKYRQGALATMGVHFARLGAMANGKMPFDAAVAKNDAQVVEVLSALPWMGFTEGSEGLSKSAKPEIWLEMDKFKQKAVALQDNAKALNVAAQTGDLAKIKMAFGTTAKSCKACHDAYKE